MAESYEVLRARADAAAAAAEEATLDNVRERELRAEKSWRGLAAQAKAVRDSREKAERARAIAREAEAARIAEMPSTQAEGE